MQYTLLVLIISVFFHIAFIILYLIQKKKSWFYLFLITAITNIIPAIILIIIVFNNPNVINSIKIAHLFWLFSGFLMVFFLGLKVSIFINIYKKSKNEENYHLNYFGKKVYNEKLVTKLEYNFLMLSIPFFVLSGAYFIVRLIKYNF